MKPVKQLICNNENGDCFRACVASILERPVESVPNFVRKNQTDEELWKLHNSWAANENFRYVLIFLEKNRWDVLDNIFCIASGKSPRGEHYHAVVWHNGIIHDPHPSNDFLAEDPAYFILLVPFSLRKRLL